MDQKANDALVDAGNILRRIAFGRTEDEDKKTGSFWTNPFLHSASIRTEARIALGHVGLALRATGRDLDECPSIDEIARLLDPNWIDPVYDLQGRKIGEWQGDSVVYYAAQS